MRRLAINSQTHSTVDVRTNDRFGVRREATSGRGMTVHGEFGLCLLCWKGRRHETDRAKECG